MRNFRGHVIVDIMKCKSMHGLNYLSFREQRLLEDNFFYCLAIEINCLNVALYLLSLACRTALSVFTFCLNIAKCLT